MGIMITASHNTYYDNGLKLFGPDGMKLSDRIEKRIETLITAGKLLEAMSTLELQQIDDDSNASEAAVAETETQDPSYYKSCTNCYRIIVSGWFLLFRQKKALQDKIISELNATDILETTSQLKTHPDTEACAWAMKWMSFNSRIAQRKLDSCGILPSDKPLLIGISKVLSPNRQEAALEFNDKMNQVFPQD